MIDIIIKSDKYKSLVRKIQDEYNVSELEVMKGIMDNKIKIFNTFSQMMSYVLELDKCTMMLVIDDLCEREVVIEDIGKNVSELILDSLESDYIECDGKCAYITKNFMR